MTRSFSFWSELSIFVSLPSSALYINKETQNSFIPVTLCNVKLGLDVWNWNKWGGWTTERSILWKWKSRPFSLSAALIWNRTQETDKAGGKGGRIQGSCSHRKRSDCADVQQLMDWPLKSPIRLLFWKLTDVSAYLCVLHDLRFRFSRCIIWLTHFLASMEHPFGSVCKAWDLTQWWVAVLQCLTNRHRQWRFHSKCIWINLHPEWH